MLSNSRETGRIPAMNVTLKRRVSASDLHVVGCFFTGCFLSLGAFAPVGFSFRLLVCSFPQFGVARYVFTSFQKRKARGIAKKVRNTQKNFSFPRCDRRLSAA